MSAANVRACPVGAPATGHLSGLNMFSPERLSCPYEAWERLQKEAPVFRVEIPGLSTPVFLVTGRKCIDQIARQSELFSNAAVAEVWRWGDMPPEIKGMFAERGYKVVHTLQSSDPPVHGKYRRIAEAAVSIAKVKALKPKIDALVRELVAALPENETFDFVDRFSVPLPMQVICLILGLPVEDADYLRRESDWFVQMVDTSFPMPKAIEATKHVVEGYDYFRRHLEKLRGHPDESLMSVYANARGDDGEYLSMDEALSMAQVTAIGGNETTRNAISSCARILASNPPLWTALKADPGKIPAFVEEVLRTNGPSSCTARTALADSEVGGVHIPKGSNVFLMWNAGGVDAAMFNDPLTINLERKNSRSHSSFGTGIHFCVGHQLARAELHAATEAWIREFETMELAVPASEVRYEPLLGFRMLHHVPMRIRRAKK
jgi:cytochrome P450